MVLFRLPVYSETWDQLKPKINKRTEKLLDKYFFGRNIQPREEDRLWYQNEIELELGQGCDYNRAVGWIDISLGCGGFHYNVYAVDSRRKKPINRRLRILRQDECFTWHVVRIKNEDSHESVLVQIKENLDYIVNNCKQFKGCFVEMSSITLLSQHINWKDLFDQKS